MTTMAMMTVSGNQDLFVLHLVPSNLILHAWRYQTLCSLLRLEPPADSVKDRIYQLASG